MNWLKKMMYGRHGMDQLSFALMIFYLLFTWTSQIFSITPLYALAIVSLFLCIFRVLSKNHSKRYIENLQFLKWWNPIEKWFKVKFKNIKSLKTHRFYKCPSCKQTLRVPKGKGKISILCPKCKTGFIKNV